MPPLPSSSLRGVASAAAAAASPAAAAEASQDFASAFQHFGVVAARVSVGGGDAATPFGRGRARVVAFLCSVVPDDAGAASADAPPLRLLAGVTDLGTAALCGWADAADLEAARAGRSWATLAASLDSTLRTRAHLVGLRWEGGAACPYAGCPRAPGGTGTRFASPEERANHVRYAHGAGRDAGVPGTKDAGTRPLPLVPAVLTIGPASFLLREAPRRDGGSPGGGGAAPEAGSLLPLRQFLAPHLVGIGPVRRGGRGRGRTPPGPVRISVLKALL